MEVNKNGEKEQRGDPAKNVWIIVNLAYEICLAPCSKHTYVFKTCFVCLGLYAVLS
jgi:hypothetical protein